MRRWSGCASTRTMHTPTSVCRIRISASVDRRCHWSVPARALCRRWLPFDCSLFGEAMALRHAKADDGSDRRPLVEHDAAVWTDPQRGKADALVRGAVALARWAQ